MSISQLLNDSIQVTRETVMNVHTAPYDVVETFGDYEIRDYAVQNLVDTLDADDSDSFNVLFNFISGANAQKEQTPMTAPVYSQYVDEKRWMAFVMPADMDSVPQPTDSDVHVDKLEAGRFATIRYSGCTNDEKEADKERLLREWIDMQPNMNLLQDNEEAIFASFNSPFVPCFMRRNEVMLRIAASHWQ